MSEGVLDRGYPLFSYRVVALGLAFWCLTCPVAAADRFGSITGIVPVSATIVGSSGVVRPITTPLILSAKAMMSGASLELPRTAWLRSTGPADVASALVLAGTSDGTSGSQRVRTDSSSTSIASTSTSSAIGAEGARAGQIASSAGLGLSGGASGAVLISRVDRRAPGYVSLAMTYE